MRKPNFSEQFVKMDTKCVKGMKGKKYSQRLHILGLATLKRRRISGDLIETFKILSGKDKSSSGDEIANVNFFYNIAHVEASAYAH